MIFDKLLLRCFKEKADIIRAEPIEHCMMTKIAIYILYSDVATDAENN